MYVHLTNTTVVQCATIIQYIHVHTLITEIWDYTCCTVHSTNQLGCVSVSCPVPTAVRPGGFCQWRRRPPATSSAASNRLTGQPQWSSSTRTISCVPYSDNCVLYGTNWVLPYIVKTVSHIVSTVSYIVLTVSYMVPAVSHIVPTVSYMVPTVSYIVPTVSYIVPTVPNVCWAACMSTCQASRPVPACTYHHHHQSASSIESIDVL